MTTNRIPSFTSAIVAISLGLLGTQCVVEDDAHDSTALDDEAVDEDDEDDEDDELRTLLGHLGSALGSPVSFNGLTASTTTAGRTNEFTPTCAGSSSPDVSYTWTAPAAGLYRFWTSKKGNLANFNTVLHVREFGNTSQTIGCNNDYNGTQWSSLVLNLQANQTVVIVVDGFGSATGSFNLGISTACAGGCTTPPSTCYQAQGTCNYVTGACGYTPNAAGSSCSDDLPCTSGDACDGAGSCVSGASTCQEDYTCSPSGCQSPCAPWGNYEYCGIDTCCIWGSNCSTCI
jgi:hypothetical protein